MKSVPDGHKVVATQTVWYHKRSSDDVIGHLLCGAVLAGPTSALGLRPRVHRHLSSHLRNILHCLQPMTRVYVTRARGLRAPRGGAVADMPEVPTAVEYDRLTGLLVELPAGPYLGAPASPGSAQAGDADGFGADGDFSDAADVDLPQAYEVDVDADGSDEQWVQQQFSSSGAVRFLQVTDAEEPQVVMMTPHYDAAHRQLGIELDGAYAHAARNCPFATLRVQTVTCSDGVTICSLCNNKGCDQTHADAEFVKSVMQHPVRLHTTVQDTFDGRRALCRCATAAIMVLWPETSDPLADFVEWTAVREPGMHPL